MPYRESWFHIYDSTLSTLRLASAYDVVSTTIYSGSTRRLSMHFGDATTLDAVSKDSFRKAAHEVGIGEKLAMKRLAAIAKKFEAAPNTTAEELTAQGFSNAAQLRNQIRSTGGYSRITKL